MPAANTDKFKKTKARFSTTLSSSINDSDTTIACSDLTGVPTDTAVNFVINRVDSNGDKTGSSDWETVTGVVSGNNITNAVRGVEGTAQAHSASTVVEVLWTADDWNEAVDGILVEHAQDGTHTSVTADDIVIADGGTLDVDTINEATTANGVTIDGLNIKDSAITTAGAVGTTAIADDAVTDAKLDSTAGKIAGEWATWTPTPSAGGSMTWTSTTTDFARYVQVGKTVYFRVRITGTTGGSADNDLQFTLPVAPNNGGGTQVVGTGYSIYGGANMCVSFVTSGSTCTVRKYSSANWDLAAGVGFNITGCYEAA